MGARADTVFMARSPRKSAVSVPLGSLTQPRPGGRATCGSCASDRVTHLTMKLTDGSFVDFLSCHHCDSKSWSHDGRALTIQEVLSKTHTTK